MATITSTIQFTEWPEATITVTSATLTLAYGSLAFSRTFTVALLAQRHAETLRARLERLAAAGDGPLAFIESDILPAWMDAQLDAEAEAWQAAEAVA